MLHIFMAITLSEIGGSQRIVYDLLSSLPEANYDITLMTSPGGELLDWIERLNALRTRKIRVVSPECIRRNISPLFDMLSLYRLIKQLKSGSYDIAHFHGSKMGTLGRLAARITGVPKIIYTVHGWGLSPQNTGSLYLILDRCERYLSHLPATTVFVSKNDMEYGINKGWAQKEKSRVIYNGIGEDPFNNTCSELITPEGIPAIVFLSQLAPPKNPLFAIEVSNILRSKGLNHRLYIIGEGPLLKTCKAQIDELKLSPYVFLLGKRTDARSLLKYMDICCHFSDREGLPISILESMYAGLPVVTNPVGGIPELVSHERTGYLVDGANPEDAADRLALLINNSELRLQMGQNARKAVLEYFSQDRMIAQYRALYETDLRSI